MEETYTHWVDKVAESLSLIRPPRNEDENEIDEAKKSSDYVTTLIGNYFKFFMVEMFMFYFVCGFVYVIVIGAKVGSILGEQNNFSLDKGSCCKVLFFFFNFVSFY